MMHSMLSLNVQAHQSDWMPQFNDRIVQAIQNEQACATSDAPFKSCQMAGHWHIKNQNEELLIHHHMCYKEWDNSTVLGAKAITLLEFIKLLEKKNVGLQEAK